MKGFKSIVWRYAITAALVLGPAYAASADTLTGAMVGGGIGLVAGKGLGSVLAGAAIGGGVGAMTQGGSKGEKAKDGAVTGAAVGAGIGLVAGKGLGGVLAGAAIGGGAGAIIGGH